MKSLSFSLLNCTRSLWIILIALSMFTACTPDEEVISLGEDEAELVLTESSLEADFEEVSSLSIDAVEMTDESSYGRMTNGIPGSILMTQGCPTLSHDPNLKKVTIDFGASCTGPGGKVRSGKIIVTYTKRLYHPGASLQVMLEDYHVDGRHIEGTKTLTNTMSNFADNISYRTTLEGGKITWPDGTYAEREFTREGTWVRGANPLLDEFHREGSIDGMRRNGRVYGGEITSTLIYKRKCKLIGVFIAVEGTRVIRRGGKPDLTLDYGDGTCDHLVTFSQNGQSRTVDVRNL